MICVDRLRESPWRYGKSCHLFDDDPADGSNGRLHEFAGSIGLDERYFQLHGKIPHYDLSEGKRIAAVAKGAKQVNDLAIKRLLRKRRWAG